MTGESSDVRIDKRKEKEEIEEKNEIEDKLKKKIKAFKGCKKMTALVYLILIFGSLSPPSMIQVGGWAFCSEGTTPCYLWIIALELTKNLADSQDTPLPVYGRLG